MKLEVTKKDVAWSYIAQFFSLGSGLIVLPMVLHKLSADEVGVNYIMITIAQIVSLLDFGFAPQFGRTITYIFSGAKSIQKVGVLKESGSDVDYHLLAVAVKTAKYVYRRLSVIVLALMLSLGTLYMYYVTGGFVNIENSLLIWILFSISTYFNIYFTYFSSLLVGAALIKESKIAMILSRTAYILISYILLLSGCGLISIVIANLAAPFISRYYSYIKFFTKEIKQKIDINIEKREITETFKALWYNAKRLGINFLGAYAITKFGMFLAGLYLPLAQMGSYGLMVQLFTILSSVSVTLFQAYSPKFSQFRVNGDKQQLIKTVSLSFIVFYFIFVIGAIVLIIFGNDLLSIIHSETILPSSMVLIVYSIIVLLEANHSQFATIIVTDNKVPFVKAGIISGLLIALFSFVVLEFTSMEIMGLILVQGIVQLAYNNWKWPKYVLDDFNIGYLELLKLGLLEFKTVICNYVKRNRR